jgi:hypothetical protein
LDERAQLERHLALFIDAYNTARRLKTLKGLTRIIHEKAAEVA